MPIYRIVFICTGNTCRSPMAAALARRYLDKIGPGDIIIESAGLYADGAPVSGHAAQAMAEIGLDISGHVSHTLTQEQCEQADVLAVMTAGHAAQLLARGVEAGRIYRLGYTPGGIPDPYGGSLETYRAARDRLASAVERMASDLSLV